MQFNYRNGAVYLVVTIRMGVAYGNRGEEYVFSKTINNPCNKSTQKSNTWVTGRFRSLRAYAVELDRFAKFTN